MIKIKPYKPKGYLVTFTRWEGDFVGTENFELTITNSEAKALCKCLLKVITRGK